MFIYHMITSQNCENISFGIHLYRRPQSRTAIKLKKMLRKWTQWGVGRGWNKLNVINIWKTLFFKCCYSVITMIQLFDQVSNNKHLLSRNVESFLNWQMMSSRCEFLFFIFIMIVFYFLVVSGILHWTSAKWQSVLLALMLVKKVLHTTSEVQGIRQRVKHLLRAAWNWWQSWPRSRHVGCNGGWGFWTYLKKINVITLNCSFSLLWWSLADVDLGQWL